MGYKVAAESPVPVNGRSVIASARRGPLQKLSVGMIVKDAENDLGRCLATIYKIADEIVIGDTGSTDTTKQIAELQSARHRSAPIEEQPEGFAGRP
jgi:glycosyltransferase involved in cell wall biosynthesis